MIDATIFRRPVIGVVDDDSRVLESLEELLASGGHDVLLFPSGSAFLAANGFERVDCVITDIGMPGDTGWDLLRISREHYPNIPVILITARDEEGDSGLAMERGARIFLRKPFDGPELLAAIDALLRA